MTIQLLFGVYLAANKMAAERSRWRKSLAKLTAAIRPGPVGLTQLKLPL
jgi:hypothetical protein